MDRSKSRGNRASAGRKFDASTHCEGDVHKAMAPKCGGSLCCSKFEIHSSCEEEGNSPTNMGHCTDTVHNEVMDASIPLLYGDHACVETDMKLEQKLSNL